MEGVDGAEETDCGTEWPDYENPDVARYRRFYQVCAIMSPRNVWNRLYMEGLNYQ